MCYCQIENLLKYCPECVHVMATDLEQLVNENKSLTVEIVKVRQANDKSTARLESVEAFLLNEQTALRADIASKCLTGLLANDIRFPIDSAVGKAVYAADALIGKLGEKV